MIELLKNIRTLYSIVIMLFITYPAITQSTFLKVYDLNIGLENGFTGFHFAEDYILFNSYHFCLFDSTANIYNNCTSLSKLSLEGDLLDVSYLSLGDGRGKNTLMVNENEIILAGHWVNINLNGKSFISKWNFELESQEFFEYSNPPGYSVHNQGIIELEDAYYLYGIGYDDVYREVGVIRKIDKNSMKLLWSKIYDEESLQSGCFALQEDYDGNLIYRHLKLIRTEQGNQRAREQIVKIDTSGKVLSKFEFHDDPRSGKSHIISSSGDIYFVCESPLIDFVTPLGGVAHKMNPNFDTIFWKAELPYWGAFTFREFFTNDIYETKNGDILISGNAWDTGSSENPESHLNYNYVGFISRITSDGDVLWTRIYKYINDHPNMPHEEYGSYLTSNLIDIHEDEAGNIFVAGTVWYNLVQLPALSAEDPRSKIILLKIDKNGCINPNYCNEVNYVNQQSEKQLVSHNNQWNITYANSWNISTKKYTFSEDFHLINGQNYKELLVSEEEEGLFVKTEIFFREMDGVVYRYDSFGESKIYDFNLELGDSISHPNPEVEIQLYVTSIDTMTFGDNIPRKVLYLSCLDPNQPSEETWIEGIGSMKGIGEESYGCSVDWTSSLTCFFENGLSVYEGESGEGCWRVNNTEFGMQDQILSIQIFPNPVKDVLFFQNFSNNFEYKLKSMNGIILKSGTTFDRLDVAYLPSGLYFIEILTNNKTKVLKFIKSN